MSVVEKAETIVRDLEAKRAAHIARGTDLQDEQANVSLAAHTGDTKARKRLDEINAALALHASELTSLDAALRAAGERVAAAKRDEAVAQERANAAQIKKVVAAMGEAAAVADDCLADLIEAGDRLKACFDKLQALGVHQPRTEQLMTLGNLAIQTALMRSQLWRRYFQHLSPSERKDFSSVVAAWCKSLEVEVERRLGEKQNEEAAA
jgi:hypothetical protein